MLAGAVDRREQPGADHVQRRGCTLLRGDQRIAGAGLHQRFEHALVGEAQVELFAQRMQRRNPCRPAACALRGSTLIAPSPSPLIAVSPKRTPFPLLHREVQLALVDVGRQHRDAAIAALGEVHRELVGVLRFDRQQRRGEVPRIVRLEIRGLIREERVGRRVRLVEAVPGEVLHQLEDLGRLLLVDALGARALP